MPFALTDHLKTNHKELFVLPSDHDKLQARLWIEFDVVKDLKDVPRISGWQPALPGFKVIPRFSYQHCGLIHSQFPYNAELLSRTNARSQLIDLVARRSKLHRATWLVNVDCCLLRKDWRMDMGLAEYGGYRTQEKTSMQRTGRTLASSLSAVFTVLLQQPPETFICPLNYHGRRVDRPPVTSIRRGSSIL
ncbi:hypothetical protein M422DRAFT_253654 [Sphaerobolus stellatus SS14]|uniref:Uncharacterized protein n=1 Tax=Sphaerobolus stellatus (strain SS14) TaxID=990650 RepID=A0A0C9V803_SPHS4|nr:hypothetical protein M422DRAFT_253654 [Sphaerobolus stellatus SS14]